MTEKIQTPAGEILLRPHDERDFEAHASYLFDSPKQFLEEIGFNTSSFTDTSKADWLEKRRSRVGKNPPVAIAAELGGRTIAVVVVGLEHADGVPRFHFHIFDSTLRGRGLGGLIFMAGVKLLRSIHGSKPAYIEPRATNQRMNGLMRKLGFKNLGEVVIEAGPATQEFVGVRYGID